ncbi:hypothetical protein ACFPOE_14120 [Caenimonas terrae]|uniref:Uncharacterized protein n=1 Tax=Caenimonas terrae TaxID=696074 RepID=A0ABW0NFJ0_9BURK
MPGHSRPASQPSTQRPTNGDFGQLSNFLRASVADEESRRVSESMSDLATHVEAIILSLRHGKVRTIIAPMLVDLLTVLRAHRHMVVGLGLPWRGLYEYAGYLQALNHLRVLIGQWLLEGGPRSTELLLNAEDFELVAWRTLAEGMLLIDVYEQSVQRDQQEQAESGLAALSEPQVERAIQWWKKLRL